MKNLSMDGSQTESSDGDLITEKENLFSIFRRGDCYNFYLNTFIVEPNHYGIFLDTLRNVPPHGEAHLYINCNGGNLSTALQIINAMNDCPAAIIGHLENDCGSAATLLFLECDHWQLGRFSTMFCHAYSRGMFGKRHEIDTDYEFSKAWLDTVITELYSPFLTKKELSDLLKGQDFYFSVGEIAERLKKVIAQREKDIRNA